MDIDKIVQIRIKQQKYICKKHLNNDFYAFIEEKASDIIAICCLQIVEYIPQRNDERGYICNVYTSDEFKNKYI